MAFAGQSGRCVTSLDVGRCAALVECGWAHGRGELGNREEEETGKF
jgi:hypothetical protein